MVNEATARVNIDKMLRDSGWQFDTPDATERANVLLEEPVIKRDGGTGAIDYLLVDKNQFPLCVIEAKNSGINPLSGKEQAREYAEGKECPFAILSNGSHHYFWDIKRGEPYQIPEFYSPASLQERANYNPNPPELSDVEVGEKYLKKCDELRDYQIKAVKAVQQAAQKGKTRFLLEMATGTGKTTTAAALCQLFLSTGQARRVLFLVDRIELENQADRNFSKMFKGIYTVRKYKGGNWREGRIVIATVQSLLANNKYREFESKDFDLVILDEAHRSVGGKSRAVLEYFLGYKIGLTATPKDYIKGTEGKTITQAAWEMRNLADTYLTFDCENGATFRYKLNEGVEDGILTEGYVVDARTLITEKLLDEGYSAPIETADDDGDEVAIFNAKDFERRYFSENTNRVLCETIIERNKLDPITGETGKTLVFCVSRSHAARITNHLNIIARETLGYTGSDFAVQVTSDVANAAEYARKFAGNTLRQKSKYAQEEHPGYKTSKARICVTVGMMTTGYDCPDLLNIALLRPIYSPSSFIQMKGRGTRRYEFRCVATNREEEKEKFNILDFFGNYEFFEEKFDYDEKIPLPQREEGDNEDANNGGGNDITPAIERPGAFHDTAPDAISTITEIKIGAEGMKVDRAMSRHELFEHVIRNSETIQQLHENEGLESVLNFVKAHVLNQSETQLTAKAIRQSYAQQYDGIDRRIGLIEMVKKALQLIERFKTRTERIDEEFDRFCDIQKPNLLPDQKEQVDNLKKFFETYLSDYEFRKIIDSGEYGRLEGYQTFDASDLEKIGAFIKETKEYIEKYLQEEIAELNWRVA